MGTVGLCLHGRKTALRRLISEVISIFLLILLRALLNLISVLLKVSTGCEVS